MSMALSKVEGSNDTRHLAAVERSLAWADAAAQQGDFAEALAWIRMLEAIGHEITGEEDVKREAWLAALAANQPRD